MKRIRVSAPGRICLFGEHQDYLHLPVITMAINRRLWITGEPLNQPRFEIDLPDIQSQENFDLPVENHELSYVKERDYWRSVFNVVRRNGVKISRGWKCQVKGTIPINSGTSSSSALCVAWTRFLSVASEERVPQFENPLFVAKLAYLAEVEEFGEPGGMMDQFASAVGSFLFQEFTDPVKVTPLNVKLGSFVLGDSMQPKDTKKILSRVKFGVLDAVEIIQQHEPDFDLRTVSELEINEFKHLVSPEQFEVLKGAVLNRDFTREALKLFTESMDEKLMGKLLNEHQTVLRELLKISTPKIERMLQAALDAGAYGGKINGSGGGGCMFVYAPDDPQKVAQAIERVGGKAYIIEQDVGVTVEEA